MKSEKAILVIADISGYTKFMTNYQRSLMHAEVLISQLIDVVLKSADRPLVVNKLEGDAVLFFGTVNTDEDQIKLTNNIIKQAENFFDTFKHTQYKLLASKICQCDACLDLDKLKLKVVIHIGEIVQKKIAQFNEIIGPDVIIAHRLLKNSIDCHEYILMTKDFYEISGGCPDKTPEFKQEKIQDIGEIDVVFYRLSPKETKPTKVEHKFLGYLWLIKLELYRLLRTLHLIPGKQYSHMPQKKLS